MAIESEKDFLLIKLAIEKTRKEQANKIYDVKIRTEADPQPLDAEKISAANDKATENMNKILNAFLDAWPTLRLERIRDFAEYEFLEAAPQEIKDIEFYIFIQPEAKELYIADFFRQCYTEDWQPIPDSPYLEVIEQARNDSEVKWPKAEPAEPTQTFKKIKKSFTSIDKVTHALVGLDKNVELGQLMLTTLQGKGAKEHGVLVGLVYDALVNYCEKHKIEIGREITEYDLFIVGTVFTLSCAGNEYISLTKLCECIKTEPTKQNIENMDETITKLSHIDLTIDTVYEAEVSNYDLIRETGRLLPIRRRDKYINGKLATGAIKLTEMPLLIEYALSRNQYADFNLSLLDDFPLKKTPRNLSTFFYLFRQIVMYRHGGKNSVNYINWQTLYKRYNITSNRKRFRNYVELMLDHLKEQNEITDYTIEKNRMTFTAKRYSKQDAIDTQSETKYQLPSTYQ